MSTEKGFAKDVGPGYLWDRTGPVDQDIGRLERLLSPLGYQSHPGFGRAPLSVRPRYRTSLAAAAVLALAICGVWFAAISLRPVESAEGWQVVAMHGNPRIGSAAMDRTGTLRVGQWLETDAHSQARVSVASIGSVTIEPASRVRLAVAQEKEHRLELARGKIEAFITAPPRLFFVNTPAATAVDLGCKYTLTVNDDGSGILEVTLGWVSLEHPEHGVESIVPHGAMCKTRPGIGPGTPYFSSASPALQRELERFDFEGQAEEALDHVLAEAAPRDDLTLWHLLSRVGQSQRERVYERLASYSAPPQNVSRHSVLRGERQALQRWRDTLTWSPMPPMSILPE